MRDKVIDIYNIKTWSTDILKYLNDADDVFKNWVNVPSKYEEQISAGIEYDRVIRGMKSVLSPNYLLGYHCTRLTKGEANIIISNGMSLQNRDTLKFRIEKLTSEGIIERKIAKQLLSTNQANDKYRKHMLWFCFFSPYMAGQSGIERFFRSWGGEALYNSHEENLVTGLVLNKIGSPAIIEALVPLSGFKGYNFELNFADRYIASKGMRKPRISMYEGNIIVNLPADNILGVIQYPAERFVELTQCNTWTPSL